MRGRNFFRPDFRNAPEARHVFLVEVGDGFTGNRSRFGMRLVVNVPAIDLVAKLPVLRRMNHEGMPQRIHLLAQDRERPLAGQYQFEETAKFSRNLTEEVGEFRILFAEFVPQEPEVVRAEAIKPHFSSHHDLFLPRYRVYQL